VLAVLAAFAVLFTLRLKYGEWDRPAHLLHLVLPRTWSSRRSSPRSSRSTGAGWRALRAGAARRHGLGSADHA
jgi:hypothetical protein